MTRFNIHEAKTHFFKLLERVLDGEEVIITKAGKPVARILPIVTSVPLRKPEIDKGKVIIKPDFDKSLDEFTQWNIYRQIDYEEDIRKYDVEVVW